MDETRRDLIASLRPLSSVEAANWLLENFPASSDSGLALDVVEHISFAKADARRLAAHFLHRLPFAQPRPYEVFARVVGVRHLLDLVSARMPADSRSRDLLFYYLLPAAREAASSDAEKDAIDAFVAANG